MVKQGSHGAHLPGNYAPLALDRVIWGEPLVDAVPAELDQRASRRALIVTSPGVRRSVPDIERLRQDPRIAGIFDRISPHAPREAVFEVQRMIVDTQADLVVTIGGGSAIDTVKVALAALSAQARTGGDLDAMAIQTDAGGRRRGPSLPHPPLRQIVVPTTLSGAEFSDLAGSVDPVTNIKQLFVGRWIGAASVLLAPEATIGTPLDIWLSTGIRALDHAVESLCSAGSNSYVDALSAGAIAQFADALPRTLADPADLAARLDSQLAVWMACSGLNRVPWGASHGIGHQIGAVANVPHGYCSCILLPHVLAFNRPVNATRQALVEQALGTTSPASLAIGELVARLGLPGRLRDIGIDRAMLPHIAETSLDNMFVRQNPRPLTGVADAMEILEAAY